MRRGLTRLLSLVIGLAAVVGLIAVFNSRDSSSLSKQTDTAAPGRPYSGDPPLSPADAAAVKRGNVLVLYRDTRPPAGTAALVPAGGSALADAGQSVVLARQPKLKAPLAALSATRIQTADTPGQLRGFVDYWIGGP